MPPQRKIDYDRLEEDWRLGVKSPRQMAEEYTSVTGVSVSHAAIVNHFKKEGVERDLSAKVKAKADAIVTRSIVTRKVTEPLPNEREIVNEVAEARAEIQISHRKGITKAHEITKMLFARVEKELASEACPIPSMVDCNKKLADTLKTLVGLEREAWGIDDKSASTENPLHIFITEVTARSKPLFIPLFHNE